MAENYMICQSCGMPLLSDEDYGNETDGRNSEYYCKYCYQSGSFTDKKTTLGEMAARCGAILSDMYEIPAENAGSFSLEQLKNLKRWSGRIVPNCESCGMPLTDGNDLGTMQNGSKSDKYCIHCYVNGKFTEPDLTREKMIKKCTPIIATQLSMTSENAEKMVRIYISSLPRWR
jgi:hypothetical protein